MSNTITTTKTTTKTKVAVVVAGAAIIASAAAGFVGIGLDNKPFDPDKCIYGYKLVEYVDGYNTYEYIPGYSYDVPGYTPGYVPPSTIAGYVPGYGIYECITEPNITPGYGIPSGYNTPGYNVPPGYNTPGYNVPPGYNPPQNNSNSAQTFEPHYLDETQDKIEKFENETHRDSSFWNFIFQKTEEDFREELDIQDRKSRFLTSLQEYLNQEMVSAEFDREIYGNQYYEDEMKDLMQATQLVTSEFIVMNDDIRFILSEMEKEEVLPPPPSEPYQPHYFIGFQDKYTEVESNIRSSYSTNPNESQKGNLENELNILEDLIMFLRNELAWFETELINNDIAFENSNRAESDRYMHEEANQDIYNTLNLINEELYNKKNELDWIRNEINNLEYRGR